jgi:hypothetical protein
VHAEGLDEGYDDPEPDQVNEDREKDDKNGRLSHERKPNKGGTVFG